MNPKETRAARDRRYYLHRRGDHTLCLSDRPCRTATTSRTSPPPVRPASSRPPRTVDPAIVLATEIARVVERLDELNRALLDNPLDLPKLAEARGQGRMLAALLDAQSRHSPAAPVAPTRPESKLDELLSRRAARFAARASGTNP